MAVDHPLGHVEWSSPLTEKYKGHPRYKSPKCHSEHAGHHQIAGSSLARVLGSTNGSCDIYSEKEISTNGEDIQR